MENHVPVLHYPPRLWGLYDLGSLTLKQKQLEDTLKLYEAMAPTKKRTDLVEAIFVGYENVTQPQVPSRQHRIRIPGAPNTWKDGDTVTLPRVDYHGERWFKVLVDNPRTSTIGVQFNPYETVMSEPSPVEPVRRAIRGAPSGFIDGSIHMIPEELLSNPWWRRV